MGRFQNPEFLTMKLTIAVLLTVALSATALFGGGHHGGNGDYLLPLLILGGLGGVGGVGNNNIWPLLLLGSYGNHHRGGSHHRRRRRRRHHSHHYYQVYWRDLDRLHAS